MDEYIKRSEVVGLVEDKLKRCETVLEALAFASLRTKVMGLRSADVAPRAEWISVEERWPDVCGMPVLMVAENEYGQTNVVKGFTDYNCPVVFCTNEMEYYGIWHAWKVTHWMPLPEPPKGDHHE